ncbi:MAG: GNAT family N-acetyltransferase [Candidatus Eisenbacteria bacterium]|nr:GNAT family N-acetyltransferase [Candidatus Eisenbacteria bacterium]
MTTEFTIRRMAESDLASVAEVEAGVFTDWYRVHRRDPEPLPERTIEELKYATSIDPDGNRVAVAADGAIVGFILARSWGSVGWFGTFGVPTQFQGLGIGKALVACTVEHLGRTASIIGLETMPESGANIGMYAKSGFALGYPTVIMEYHLERKSAPAGKSGDREGACRAKADDPDVAAWSSLDAETKPRLEHQIKAIGDEILPGLDYTPEVRAIERHELGDTYLCMDGEDVEGVAVLRTAPFRTDDRFRRGYLHVLALRRECNRRLVLDRLLGCVFAGARAAGASGVVAGVSARYPEALEMFHAAGFRSQRASVRMIERSSRPDIFERSAAINSSRWVG